MKKHTYIRDLRNQQIAERKHEYQKQNSNNQNSQNMIKLNETNKVNPEIKTSKTNNARAVGIKSTMYYNGKVIMSTYDNNSVGNTIIEKEILSDKVYDLNAPYCYTAMLNNGSIKATNSYFKNTTANVENPANKNKPGDDLIHAKDLLELKYFGKTFDDNIHIQIAYNIVDIEKILAKYINTIVFSLNNIVLPKGNMDFVGNLFSTTCFNEFKCKKNAYDTFLKLYSNNKRLLYFASVFEKDGKIRSDEEIYEILTFVSQWRQFLFHQDIISNLYCPDNWMSDARKNIIYEIYENHKIKFSDNFYINNEFIIKTLINKLNISTEYDAKKFVKRFLNFAAKKEHLHIGISIKKLRKIIVERKHINIHDHRINTIIDFLIYNYYLDNEDDRNNIILQLRNFSCNQGKKQEVYSHEAERLCDAIPELLVKHRKIEQYFNVLQTIKCEINKGINILNSKKTNNTFFVSLYFLSLFLNQKEKNVMFSELRHSFKSIIGFIDVLSKLGEKTVFIKQYCIFGNKNILSEFDYLNCLSRRKSKIFKYQKLLDIMINDVVVSFNNKLTQPKNIERYYSFIINKILDTWSYSYLMHYTNPKIVYNIMHKPLFVKYVLSSIEEKNIDKYYMLFSNERNLSFNKKIDYLASKVSSLIFEDIILELENIDNKCYDTKTQRYDDKKRRRLKNILENKIQLYFTIPYLFIKNLINVNSRYFIALYALERDYELFYPGEDIKTNYCKLAIEKRAKKDLIKFDCNSIDNRAIRIFRNQVAHLNVIQNLNNSMNQLNIKKFTTYFELYNYLLQFQISLQYGKSVKNETCENTRIQLLDVKNKYHAYSREFLKQLCLPFYYNFSRYRNLTEDHLFNAKNHNVHT